MTKLLERPEVRPHDSSVIEAPRREVPVRKEPPPAPKRGIRWMRWMAVVAAAVASVVALILAAGDGGPSAAYPVWDPPSRNTAWIETLRVRPLYEIYAPVTYPVWDPVSRSTAWIEEMRVHPLTEMIVPAEPHALSAFRTPFDIEAMTWMDVPVWDPSPELIESQARVHPLTEMYVPASQPQ